MQPDQVHLEDLHRTLSCSRLSYSCFIKLKNNFIQKENHFWMYDFSWPKNLSLLGEWAKFFHVERYVTRLTALSYAVHSTSSNYPRCRTPHALRPTQHSNLVCSRLFWLLSIIFASEPFNHSKFNFACAKLTDILELITHSIMSGSTLSKELTVLNVS